MISLPPEAMPNQCDVKPIDPGFIQTTVGGAGTRIDRPGARFEMTFGFPPLPEALARVVVRRLMRAKSEGLRTDYPLTGGDQGDPGTSAVVDGSTSGGRTLHLRGVNTGWIAQEGYALTVIDSNGDAHFHLSEGNAVADGDGKVSLSLDPPLAVFPADGNVVLLAQPVVQGLVTSVVEWSLSPDGLTRGVQFTLSEA